MTDGKKFDQFAYNSEYRKKNYDRIEITLPKGERERLRALAAAAGQSVSEYILQAVNERAERNV